MKSLSALALLTLFSLPLTAQAGRVCPDLLNYEFKRLLSGNTESVCQYQGQVILVVNTASRCGLTPQFDALLKIYVQYISQGLVVLGFPSNDYKQEPGQVEQIIEFCKLNYGVDFRMYEKSSVTGAMANPFYKALSTSAGTEPQWNFHKYLIARDTKAVIPFGSHVEPGSTEMRGKIEALLERKD